MYANEGLGFITLIPSLITAGTTIYTAEQQRKIASQQAAATQAQATAIQAQAQAEQAKVQQVGFQFPKTGTLLLMAIGIPAGIYIMSRMKGK